jgi:hypothetical protein
LGCQIWLTSDDNDVVMAVTTMMVVVRFCKCSSRQQHDDREQEGLFHISIIAGVSGVQTTFTLAFITSWGYASGVSYNGSQLLPSIHAIQFSASPTTNRHGYSMRSSRMIGNLRITLGTNSRSKLPPASVAIEIKKVLATTEAVMLGSG